MLSNNLIKRDTTGAFALIDSLVRHKVKHIFGYPGGAILPIYDELYAWEQEGFIEHILVRHEQGAAHASDADSRVTRQKYKEQGVNTYTKIVGPAFITYRAGDDKVLKSHKFIEPEL